MFTRRFSSSILLAAIVTAAIVGPAAAREPQPTSPAPAVLEERPLTREEQAAADRKVAESDAYLASEALSGADLASLSCFTPTGGPTTTAAAAPTACYVPAGYLAVTARDQERGHWCGPAVGQVISNWSWASKSWANKYSQTKIAGWMRTDVFGGTSAPYLEYGLEVATGGSPRRPAGWNWVVMDVRDRDRDGHTADELQGYVRSNVSGSKMPLAIPVKPHQPWSKYYLTSWPKPIVSVGHWIAAYGWYGNYTGTTFARIYYTDSSRDEGGSTGKFWDPTRDIAALINEHTRRIVW
ncbi:MAG: hypothetical protein ACRDGD_08290 [Candidatus Limnocylindria bacterium]